MRMWAVLNSVKANAFNECYLSPFTMVCIWWSVYHITYFITYFRRLCFASVCSYNRDTRCSEARPLIIDRRATRLACCAVQRQCSVSSCCSRPVSDSDQCLLVQACCASIHDLRQMRHPPLLIGLQSPRARWNEFPVDASCNLV